MTYFQDFRTKNGSSQGQHLALTVLCVPFSLESGPTVFVLQVGVRSTLPSSVSAGWIDFSEVDIASLREKIVSFGEEMVLGSLNR